MKKYVGHPSQVSGVEELILAKGKGKGMTLLEIRNGKGLQITLSADRCMDISRVSFNGANMGYFAPAGYVAPAYYDNRGDAFLKSFNAGFLTTCGIDGVGSPSVDNGVEVPMHGTISNIPCDNYYYIEDEEKITVVAQIRDAVLFGVQLVLNRTYVISKTENSFTLKDEIENTGVMESPCMLLYHYNMGYPLLCENSKVVIPHNSAVARDDHAQTGFDQKLIMEKPQSDYQEMCYYYDLKETDGIASVGIFNPDISKGVKISFDKSTLDNFVQWKMMGENEYVLGLEPSNCTTAGRVADRESGMLKFIAPGGKYNTFMEVSFTEKEEDITSL